MNKSTYHILDLFCGCGGMSLGFERAGYDVLLGIDVWKDALATYAYNHKKSMALCADLASLNPVDVDEKIGGKHIDVIIGGPPCQSFSTVGQRVYDEKALLYEEYLRILRIARPKMFLFENVKGILSMRETFYQRDEAGNVVYETTKNKETGFERKKPVISGYGRKVMDIITEKFANIDDRLGYTISKEVLNAVDFGVPENRERVFIVGIRNDLNINW